MTKKQLVQKLSESSGMPKSDARLFLDTFCEQITFALRKGESVVVPTFGSFSVQTRGVYNGINPITGEKIMLIIESVPHFNPAKSLKEIINEK